MITLTMMISKTRDDINYRHHNNITMTITIVVTITMAVTIPMTMMLVTSLKSDETYGSTVLLARLIRIHAQTGRTHARTKRTGEALMQKE